MILILISVTQSYSTCSRCILKKFHVILSTYEVIAFLVLLSHLKKVIEILHEYQGII